MSDRYRAAGSRAGVSRENPDRMSDDRQSKPRSNPPLVEGPRHGNSAISAPTRHADHFEAVPNADSGVQDSAGICDRLNVPHPEYREAVCDRVARTSVCRAKSRVAIKLGVRSLTKNSWRLPGLRFSLIQQPAQRRTWTRIPNDFFPCRIAIQFGEERWKVGDQPGTFIGRQLLNSCFDFGQGAHDGNLRCHDKPGKPSRTTQSNGFSGQSHARAQV
jgi:hypothetical protein